MTDAVNIMLIAGCTGGRVHPETYDLIAFGQKLQGLGAGAMGVWVLGEDVDAAAVEMASRGGVRVTVVQCAGTADYVNETHGAVLAREIAAVKPDYVCAAHTSRGWEWAPAVAARLGAGCISAVDGVVESQGRLCFQRDVLGGKVKGLYASSAATTVITVQPGVFKFAPAADASQGAVERKRSDCQPERTRYLGLKQTIAETSDITTAPIIVAVGNGIGEEDNMPLIHHLAELLPKAAVAGTRTVCDRGWLGYSRQVGITGSSVSPALYIACGISGASQHVMGMRGAKFVIAINTDPCAPIFKEADICIVEDIIHFIPLIEKACLRLADVHKRAFVDQRTPEED